MGSWYKVTCTKKNHNYIFTLNFYFILFISLLIFFLGGGGGVVKNRWQIAVFIGKHVMLITNITCSVVLYMHDQH